MFFSRFVAPPSTVADSVGFIQASARMLRFEEQVAVTWRVSIVD
jgi:hypothetical protein